MKESLLGNCLSIKRLHSIMYVKKIINLSDFANA